MTALSNYHLMVKVMKLMSLYDDRDSLFWRWDEDEKEMMLYVMCNDLFYWATADLEQITHENVDLLKQSYVDCKIANEITGVTYATQLFACRVRGMRPQGAAYPGDVEFKYTDHTEIDSQKAIRYLMDQAGPVRTTDDKPFGNPYERPEDAT